jgi:hypothetical protein
MFPPDCRNGRQLSFLDRVNMLRDRHLDADGARRTVLAFARMHNLTRAG